MIKFEKVSFNEYYKSVLEAYKDYNESTAFTEYNNIVLPSRATENSCGYDFVSPMTFHIDYRNLVFPTGVRLVTDRDDIFLMCVPRSGLGFRYGLGLKNTVGIIDGDYWKSDNEGHIKVKFKCENPYTVECGKKFMQGILIPYIKTDEDSCNIKRNGGFGSTDTPVSFTTAQLN